MYKNEKKNKRNNIAEIKDNLRIHFLLGRKLQK